MCKSKKTQKAELELHDRFGLGLSKALQQHSEPFSQDFTQLVLEQLGIIQNQKILRSVIIQEKLALAGCILLVFAAVIFVFAFPHIIPAAVNSAGSFIKSGIEKISWGSFDLKNLFLIMVSAAVGVYYILDLRSDGI